MIAAQAMSLRARGAEMEILDQRWLPAEEKWRAINSVSEMVAAIRELQVRGAPLIGVAAVLALAQSGLRGASNETLKRESRELRESRPTAVNLMRVLDRMDALLTRGASAEALAKEAQAVFDEDVTLCERIAENGAVLFNDGDNVLTHCNTGGLATAGRGTALGVLAKAHESGKHIHVWVDETRPLLQGARLTAWECKKLGIPATLIADSMAAHQMALGRVSKVIVGADRIAMNGDFANKIGTYGLAVLCFFHRIPFYVAAPATTLDPDCPHGGEIPIEQRHPREVRGLDAGFQSVAWAPHEMPVDNPAFDVTPADLISGWILDRGVFRPDDVKRGALKEAAQGGSR